MVVAIPPAVFNVAGATNVRINVCHERSLTDLDNPVLRGQHNNGNTSIDHNVLIKDGLAYQSNYTSGLRVTDTFQVDQGRLPRQVVR
jgi:hypothetical protein